MSNKFLPLDIEHRGNGKLANPQNPKMLACENERDTICVCRLLSLGNLCRRWQTVSPPLHFTSHELVNIIQRHLFSLNVFPSSFLLFLFLLFFKKKFLWVLSFAIGWWWHDALEQHHCSRGLFRSNTKHVPNYLMYTPPIDSPRYSPITRWLVVWFLFSFLQ